MNFGESMDRRGIFEDIPYILESCSVFYAVRAFFCRFNKERKSDIGWGKFLSLLIDFHISNAKHVKNESIPDNSKD